MKDLELSDAAAGGIGFSRRWVSPIASCLLHPSVLTVPLRLLLSPPHAPLVYPYLTSCASDTSYRQLVEYISIVLVSQYVVT